MTPRDRRPDNEQGPVNWGIMPKRTPRPKNSSTRPGGSGRLESVRSANNHIACSSLSRSEIVVPLFSDDRCIGVLDVDSEHLAQFDETDALYLGELAKILAKRFKASRQAA